MVDTVRSLSALQALLADNVTGDISAQDLRDAIISLWSSTIPLWTDDAHVAGQLVRRADGKIYRANDAITSGTPFTIGTTGATWTAIIDGSNIIAGVNEGQLVTVDSGGLPTASSMTETTPRIRSTKELQVPGSGGLIVANLDILGQGLVIGVEDLATNRMFLPVMSELTTPGSQRPQDLGLAAVSNVFQQTSEGEAIAAAASSVQFSNQNTLAGTAISFSLRRPPSAGVANNCNIVVRLNNHTDPNPILDYKRDAPNAAGFTLSGENPVITFPVPAFFPGTTVIYTTIVSDDGDNLDLLGATLDLGDGAQLIPAGTIQGRLSTPRPLAFQSEIPTTENIQDIVAAMFTGGTHSGISFVYDDVDGFIDATVTGVTPPIGTAGSVSSFSINLPDTVNVGTDINTARTITFTTANTTDIATLELVVTTGNNISLTVPASDGTHTVDVTLSGISTSTPGTRTFQIQGTLQDSTAIMSNTVTVTIRAQTADEFAYYGVRATNDFATVDTALLTSVDVQPPGTQYTIAGTWPAGETLGILEPADRTISSIVETAFGSETLSRWTVTNSARTINTQAYNLYTLVNNGPSGNFAFRVTHA